MRNEKGFIFPTTMLLVLFCLFIVGYITTALVSEKNFYSDTEEYYLLENLMQLAVDQSLEEIKSESPTYDPFTFDTINGSITFVISEMSPSIYEAELTCRTNQKTEYTASYQYDHEKNEMIVWSEY